jgi:mRNA interferase RelE/StbE
MKIVVEKSFIRDVDKIIDKRLLKNLQNLIAIIEKVESVSEIPHIKKIKGYNYYYRIRIGNYRLGFSETPYHGISFIRLLHRKDIYRYFPSK